MVLIVGAGPAGLNATLSLLHYGVHDIVIVDFILQGDNTSRAAVIHAATIERILTEQLRERALNVDVHRPYKVTDMRQNVKDRQVIDVLFEDKQVVSAKSVLQLASASEPIRNYCGSLQHRASHIAMQPRRETRSERRGILMPLLNAPSSYHLVWYTWLYCRGDSCVNLAKRNLFQKVAQGEGSVSAELGTRTLILPWPNVLHRNGSLRTRRSGAIRNMASPRPPAYSSLASIQGPRRVFSVDWHEYARTQSILVSQDIYKRVLTAWYIPGTPQNGQCNSVGRVDYPSLLTGMERGERLICDFRHPLRLTPTDYTVSPVTMFRRSYNPLEFHGPRGVTSIQSRHKAHLGSRLPMAESFGQA
ncbi:hypothetical protein EV363DRAFT_1297094 [Boletus edulis]|nr:hypothetical protein EV363DRAFT_1297094 [Boletus edulis]